MTSCRLEKLDTNGSNEARKRLQGPREESYEETVLDSAAMFSTLVLFHAD